MKIYFLYFFKGIFNTEKNHEHISQHSRINTWSIGYLFSIVANKTLLQNFAQYHLNVLWNVQGLGIIFQTDCTVFRWKKLKKETFLVDKEKNPRETEESWRYPDVIVLASSFSSANFLFLIHCLSSFHYSDERTFIVETWDRNSLGTSFLSD